MIKQITTTTSNTVNTAMAISRGAELAHAHTAQTGIVVDEGEGFVLIGPWLVGVALGKGLIPVVEGGVPVTEGVSRTIEEKGYYIHV